MEQHPPDLIVRYSRWEHWLSVIWTLLVAAFFASFLLFGKEEAPGGMLLICFFALGYAAFLAWKAATRDYSTPVLTITTRGMVDHRLSDNPVAWHFVRDVEFRAGSKGHSAKIVLLLLPDARLGLPEELRDQAWSPAKWVKKGVLRLDYDRFDVGGDALASIMRGHLKRR